MGRGKKKFSPLELENISKLASFGVSKRTISAKLGFDYSLWFVKENRASEFYDKGRANEELRACGIIESYAALLQQKITNKELLEKEEANWALRHKEYLFKQEVDKFNKSIKKAELDIKQEYLRLADKEFRLNKMLKEAQVRHLEEGKDNAQYIAVCEPMSSEELAQYGYKEEENIFTPPGAGESLEGIDET